MEMATLLFGESHGQRRLEGYSSCGHKSVGNNLATKQYIKKNKRCGTMYLVITGNMDVVRKILSKLTEITQLLRK